MHKKIGIVRCDFKIAFMTANISFERTSFFRQAATWKNSVCLLTPIVRVLAGARDTASLHHELPWPSNDAEICRGWSNISRTFLKTDLKRSLLSARTPAITHSNENLNLPQLKILYFTLCIIISQLNMKNWGNPSLFWLLQKCKQCGATNRCRLVEHRDKHWLNQ